MVKKFSIEFKPQSVNYALSNAHLSIGDLVNYLGVVNQRLINGLGKLIQTKQVAEN